MATAARRTARTYRQWLARGFGRPAAGNLTALRAGHPAVARRTLDARGDREAPVGPLPGEARLADGRHAGNTLADPEPWPRDMTAEGRHEGLLFSPLAEERVNAAGAARLWAEEHAR